MAVKINGMEFDTVEEAQKAYELGLVEKHDTVSPSASAQVPHGTFFNQNRGGLLSRPGGEPDIFSAMTRPTGSRFLAALFSGVTTVLNPEYSILSGVKDGVGDNADDFCAPGPTAGDAKLCTTRNSFGAFKMDTDKVEINKIGGRLNRADMDQMVVNAGSINPLMPSVLSTATNINSQTGLSFFRFGVEAERRFMRVIISGNVNTTGADRARGFIKEFDGFDRLIKTGYQDVESGDLCPAADSVVRNFGALVNGTVDGGNIVEHMSGMHLYFRDLAEDTGFAPTVWYLLMHPDLFNALTLIWPCSYLTDGCGVSNGDGQRVNVSADMQLNMRNEMRNGKFLWLNGERVPVETTSADEQTPGGLTQMLGSVRFVPLLAGGRRVAYLEGFDQGNADIREYINANGVTGYRFMNGGFWAQTERRTDACHESSFMAQPRLVLRTPWLAGRIENIAYTVLGSNYSRSAYPEDRYFVNGGRYYSDAMIYT